VVSMLDGSSEEGDSFVFENLRITVKQSDGVRIEKILVEEIEEE